MRTIPQPFNITANGELSHGDTMNEESKSVCPSSGHAADVMGNTLGTSEGDSASSQQVTLTGLRSSTSYSITVAAYMQ